RRRGPVARAAARLPAHRGAHPWAGPRRARRGRGGDGGGARRGRHLLRRALRQRQRGVGLLRPLARGVRPGRSPLSALRHPDPPRLVREPLLLPLPPLLAPPAQPAPLIGAPPFTPP